MYDAGPSFFGQGGQGAGGFRGFQGGQPMGGEWADLFGNLFGGGFGGFGGGFGGAGTAAAGRARAGHQRGREAVVRRRSEGSDHQDQRAPDRPVRDLRRAAERLRARRPRRARNARGGASSVRARASSPSASLARGAGAPGRSIEHPCPTCSGTGTNRALKKFTVPLPAGVKDGTKIRLKGKGEPGAAAGPPAICTWSRTWTASPLFERRGSDLVIEVPVTMVEAALGASVRVPTPEGSVALKVPAGTQDGRQLRDQGQGRPQAGRVGQGRPDRSDQGADPRGSERRAEGPAQEVRRVAQGGSARRAAGLEGLSGRATRVR